MTLIESLGDRVRQLRESKGKTQDEVADGIGLSRTSLNKIETGKTTPHASTLKKIAAYFDVSETFLRTGRHGLAEVPATAPKKEGILPTMAVVEDDEEKKYLRRENETLREQVKLLTDILRSGGDLSKLSNFNEGNPEAVEAYTHQRVVVEGLVRYQMRYAA